MIGQVMMMIMMMMMMMMMMVQVIMDLPHSLLLLHDMMIGHDRTGGA
jgi:hypothetical protein